MRSDVRLVFPYPSSWTDYVVRPSTGDERHVFQIQVGNVWIYILH